MTETKEFPTAVIASLSSGISLCSFCDMHEAAEYLMGHPIWTHHFASKGLWKDMQEAVLEQHPKMPVALGRVSKGNYLAKVAELEAAFGKHVTIRKGSLYGIPVLLVT
jgi:hypothetical protein